MPAPVFYLEKMKTARDIFNGIPKDIYCFADGVAQCAALLDAGAKIIQVRNKHIGGRAFSDMVADMITLTRHHADAVLIVNDRVSVALATGADGIHIGQDDMDYRNVIHLVESGMIVGVSVDTAQEARDAEKAGAAYVGAGSVFPTSTKPDAPVIGERGLSEVVRAVNIPVVAIGGISAGNINQIADSGARHFAVISDLNESGDIPGRLNTLRRIIMGNFS